MAVAIKQVLDWLSRIVGHRHRSHPYITHGKFMMTIDHFEIGAGIVKIAAFKATRSEVDPDIVFIGQGYYPFPMVTVLVSYQNTAEILGALSQPGHALDCVSHRKTTVHHQAGVAPFNQRRVAFTATTQRCKPHYNSGLGHIRTQLFKQAQRFGLTQTLAIGAYNTHLYIGAYRLHQHSVIAL